MDFAEAQEFLSKQTRWELRDHAFGDSEFGWNNAEGKEVAGGYSGGSGCDIWITDQDITFHGDQARALKKCGTLGVIERNDETGPDTYVEGQIMPGCTKEGVLKGILTLPSSQRR